MVREGLFNDVDVVLAWHPDDEIRADTRSQPGAGRLRGRVPRQGGPRRLRSLERPQRARRRRDLHPRPQPDARARAAVGPHALRDRRGRRRAQRDPRARQGLVLGARLQARQRSTSCSSGCARSPRARRWPPASRARCASRAGDYEMLVEHAPARALLHANLSGSGRSPSPSKEQEFARPHPGRGRASRTKGLDGAIQPLDENPGEPEGGSTDVADVSWNVPTLHLSVDHRAGRRRLARLAGGGVRRHVRSATRG